MASRNHTSALFFQYASFLSFFFFHPHLHLGEFLLLLIDQGIFPLNVIWHHATQSFLRFLGRLMSMFIVR
jgi:hypothetical protein